MKLIIDIPYGLKDVYEHGNVTALDVEEMKRALQNGTPIPEKHGRLIDADAFIKKVKKDRTHCCYIQSWTADDVLDVLNRDYAPTILEATKESEG